MSNYAGIRCTFEQLRCRACYFVALNRKNVAVATGRVAVFDPSALVKMLLDDTAVQFTKFVD